MTKETEHKNIYVALAAAQQEMGPVVKGAENPHFKSKYADLADVMQVALPALNANGIACFATIEGNGQQVMRTTFYHGTSETSVHCDVPLMVAKSDMQGMKSAVTYAKRIGLESLAGIAPEDDDGNAAKEGVTKYRQEQEAAAANAHVRARQGAQTKLTEAATLAELQLVWKSLPVELQAELKEVKEDMKAALKLEEGLDGDGIPDFDKAGPDVGDGHEGDGGP